MDYKKMFENIDKDFGSNLTVKIGNPPVLKSRDFFCVWSDLLGFGNVFFENNWNLSDKQNRSVYERLQKAHSIVLYNSGISNERNLILNDGIAKVYQPQTKERDPNNILSLSLFLRSAIQLHIEINEIEAKNGYPGCRTVLSFGQGIEYLVDEIRFDDYVMNYTKPQGQEISDIAKSCGNPIMIYNPRELQMNTAFSKAYTLESYGSKINLAGNKFFVEQSVIDSIEKIVVDKGYKPKFIETDKFIDFLVPYNSENNDEVVLGFKFSKPIIDVDIKGWKTKVYKLLSYYPHDEKISEFQFELK
jgi:hypothetical protein